MPRARCDDALSLRAAHEKLSFPLLKGQPPPAAHELDLAFDLEGRLRRCGPCRRDGRGSSTIGWLALHGSRSGGGLALRGNERTGGLAPGPDCEADSKCKEYSTERGENAARASHRAGLPVQLLPEQPWLRTDS